MSVRERHVRHPAPWSWPPRRRLGPAGPAVAAAAFALLWVITGPPAGGWVSFAGQHAVTPAAPHLHGGF
jgi:hypothetical protein